MEEQKKPFRQRLLPRELESLGETPAIPQRASAQSNPHPSALLPHLPHPVCSRVMMLHPPAPALLCLCSQTPVSGITTSIPGKHRFGTQIFSAKGEAAAQALCGCCWELRDCDAQAQGRTAAQCLFGLKGKETLPAKR